jgi:hypothetical protein
MSSTISHYRRPSIILEISSCPERCNQHEFNTSVLVCHVGYAGEASPRTSFVPALPRASSGASNDVIPPDAYAQWSFVVREALHRLGRQEWTERRVIVLLTYDSLPPLIGQTTSLLANRRRTEAILQRILLQEWSVPAVRFVPHVLSHVSALLPLCPTGVVCWLGYEQVQSAIWWNECGAAGTDKVATILPYTHQAAPCQLYPSQVEAAVDVMLHSLQSCPQDLRCAAIQRIWLVGPGYYEGSPSNLDLVIARRLQAVLLQPDPPASTAATVDTELTELEETEKSFLSDYTNVPVHRAALRPLAPHIGLMRNIPYRRQMVAWLGTSLVAAHAPKPLPTALRSRTLTPRSDEPSAVRRPSIGVGSGAWITNSSW